MNHGEQKLRDMFQRRLEDLQPTTALETIRRRARRGRALVALATILVVSLVGIGSFALTNSTERSPDRVVGPGPESNDDLIAFTTQGKDDPSPWIAIVRVGGGDVSRLHEGRDPSWSPDGSRIAFGCDRGICTMNADGSDIRQLTDPKEPAFDESPDWGPNGWIAFTRNYMDNPRLASARPRDIGLVREDGSQQITITDHNSDDSEPTWSPDGQSIAYLRAEGGPSEAPPGGWHLWTMDADGTKAQMLTDIDGPGRPDWSPDGQVILFDRASALWTIPAGGGEAGKLPIVSGRGFDVGSFAAFAPDSRRITFICSSTGTDNNDICLSDVNSEEWTPLIATGENEASPAWQPRTPVEETDEPAPTETLGEFLVGSEDVVMAFGSEGDIWLALSDGSVVNITETPQTESNPTISFDDKVLVYEREGRLIYLRLDTGESAEFADGYSPAFGPLDYLAWDSGAGEVVVGSPFSDWTVRAPNGPRGQGATSFSFAWDQSLEVLYYSVAFGHGVDPYYIDIVRVDGWECADCGGGLELGRVQAIQPDDGTEGEFLSTSFGTSVDVLRVCCRESDTDGWETAEIGGLDPFDTGTIYNRIRGLDDVPLDLGGSGLGLAHAGSLEATVKGEVVDWRVSDRTAWFLINDQDLWLVTDGQEPEQLPFKIDGGVAVAPTFARSPLIHSF